MLWNKYRLFKKKNISSKIANQNIYCSIPSYEELDNESKRIAEKYKEEYISLFKTISSTNELDLDLFNEIKIYQDLLLNVLYQDNFGEILESKICGIKLNIYARKYMELNKTLILKYIALQEIKKDKKYLSFYNRLYFKAKYKINIANIINYHENTLYNLIAIINEKVMKCISISTVNNPKLDNYKDQLENKYNSVNKDYKLIFGTDIHLSNSVVESIAKAEIELERYVLENRNKLSDYKNRLISISNSDIKDTNDRDNIIKELMNIKKNYIVFSKYGRNLVEEKDLNELYLIIFNVYNYFPLTSTFNNYYSSIEDEKEKRVYIAIINYKLELLLQKKSNAFTKYDDCSDSIVNDILYIIEDIKEEDDKNLIDKIDPENIIQNHLDLFLSLDYEDGFRDYFNYVFPNNLRYLKEIPFLFNSGEDSIKFLCGILVGDGVSDFKKINTSLVNYKLGCHSYASLLIKYKNELLLYHSLNKNKLRIVSISKISDRTSINLSYHCSVVYAIPNKLSTLILNGRNENIIEKIIIPSEVGESFYIYLYPDISSVLLEDIEKSTANLGKSFIFPEEILLKSPYDLEEYLMQVFSFYYHLSYSYYNPKRPNKLVKLYFKLFEGISLIDSNGNIRSINLQNSIYSNKVETMNREEVYDYAIDCLTNCLIKYKKSENIKTRTLKKQ